LWNDTSTKARAFRALHASGRSRSQRRCQVRHQPILPPRECIRVGWVLQANERSPALRACEKPTTCSGPIRAVGAACPRASNPDLDWDSHFPLGVQQRLPWTTPGSYIKAQFAHLARCCLSLGLLSLRTFRALRVCPAKPLIFHCLYDSPCLQ